MSGPNCGRCVHRGHIVPGSSRHISCAHPVARAAPFQALGVLVLSGRIDVEPMEQLPQGFRLVANDHGITQGWCSWPLEFDQIWIRECTGYAEHIPSPTETTEA